MPPERDYAGEDLERGTGVAGASLRGVHLRLPGLGPDAPTLEIYQYSREEDALTPAANRPGFAHIAFAVPDVEEARNVILAAGGKAVGEVVTLTTADGRHVTWCYVTDPEGNIIELQAWADDSVLQRRASDRAAAKRGIPSSTISSEAVRLIRNQPGTSTIEPGRTRTRWRASRSVKATSSAMGERAIV